MQPDLCRPGINRSIAVVQVFLLFLAVIAPLATANAPQALQEASSGSVRDACALGQYVRPIVFAPGFGASILYNSSDTYNTAYPTSSDLFGETDAAENLALPLQWHENGTQNFGDAGPQSSPDDALPGVDGLARFFISAVRPHILCLTVRVFTPAGYIHPIREVYILM